MGCTKPVENFVMLTPNEKIIVSRILCITYTLVGGISDKMPGMKTITSHRGPGQTPAAAGNATRFLAGIENPGQRDFEPTVGQENPNSLFSSGQGRGRRLCVKHTGPIQTPDSIIGKNEKSLCSEGEQTLMEKQIKWVL